MFSLAQPDPENMPHQILVVDDDPLIRKGLKFQLGKEGYEVVTATCASAALEQVKRLRFDAAILDIGLPDEDGLSLCKHLKARKDFPIIFLTARRRELDEIVGLEIGGDDYITKPFNVDVLLAHLRAVLRRASQPVDTRPARREPLSLGPFHLDPRSHHVTREGQPVSLAPREFDLLHFFLSHPDRVFTADEIIERVWGAEYVGEPQVLYVQIRSLREKIEQDPSQPDHVITLRGVGYKFVA
jgi:DNA-binding response OmpR family regulator